MFSTPQHQVCGGDESRRESASAASVKAVPVGCKSGCMCGLHNKPMVATAQNSLNLAWKSQFGVPSPGSVRRGA